MTVTYSREDLLADPPFARRLHHDGRLLHGGLDDEDRYLPPRSAHRLDAIHARREALSAAGHPVDVLGQEVIPRTSSRAGTRPACCSATVPGVPWPGSSR